MISFDTGLSALRAAQMAMQVVGQNVSNADTEGYSRQSAILESIGPTTSGLNRAIGRGVEVQEVRREADDLLSGRLRTEAGVEGRLDVLVSRLAEIETVFAEPGGASLSAAMNDFFDRMSEVSVNSGDPTLRAQALLAAEGLAETFSSMATRLDSIRRGIRPEVESEIGDINEMTRAIAGLNRQIVAANQKGDHANELLDQRERLLRDLSRKLEISVVDDPSGSRTVLAAGRLLVAGDRAETLRLGPADGGPIRLTIAGSDQPFEPTGGALRGLAEIENQTVPQLIERLDTLARELAWEVNSLHARGVGAAGSYVRMAAAHGADPDRPLADAGLPFTPEAGTLTISVTRISTGEVEQHRIDFDPARQGLRDLAGAIDGLEGVRTSLDLGGRLHIRALTGYTFDFSDRVDPDPGALGGSTVELSGRYLGDGNAPVTLRAVGTGRIGVTEGLAVEVLSSDGALLKTIDVGRGYSPGDPLELAPGVTVRFDTGNLTLNDTLGIELVSEPDTGGLMPALGLNALFVGGSASELRLADGVAENPSALALGRGGNGGDNSVALDLIAIRDRSFEGLDGGTPGEFYGLLVADVGQKRRSNETLQQNEESLVRALEARRQEVAGVSVDEEMVNLIRYQRGFEAAARFLTTINEVTELLVMLR